MAPYVFMERNGIHIIDLNKTVAKIEEAASAMKQIVKCGKNILFVATKKQAKDIVSEKLKKLNMPYITERWPGGLLTNFVTIRKAIKKMQTIDKMKEWPEGTSHATVVLVASPKPSASLSAYQVLESLDSGSRVSPSQSQSVVSHSSAAPG